jgi:hypothetical protein
MHARIIHLQVMWFLHFTCKLFDLFVPQTGNAYKLGLGLVLQIELQTSNEI